MISPLALVSQWKSIAVLVLIVALGAGLLWYRGEAARAEVEVAQFRGAYDLLAARVAEQNAAVQEWERRAALAAETGRRARAEAAGAVTMARQHADALTRAMAAPRVASECPVREAVQVIRADLSAAQ